MSASDTSDIVATDYEQKMILCNIEDKACITTDISTKTCIQMNSSGDTHISRITDAQFTIWVRTPAHQYSISQNSACV